MILKHGSTEDKAKLPPAGVRNAHRRRRRASEDDQNETDQNDGVEPAARRQRTADDDNTAEEPAEAAAVENELPNLPIPAAAARRHDIADEEVLQQDRQRYRRMANHGRGDQDGNQIIVGPSRRSHGGLGNATDPGFQDGLRNVVNHRRGGRRR